jgi:hypothetical protein
MDQEQKEELRESIWQSHKKEENQLIKQIEEAQRTLQLKKKYNEFEPRITHEEAQHKLQQLQKKFSEFETRVTLEVDIALHGPKIRLVKFVLQDINKPKIKCSICKLEGHNKRSCKVIQCI